MRLILKLLLLLSLVLAALIGSIAWWANAPLQMRVSTVDFRIAPGSSLRSAVTQMQDAGIAVNPDLLAMLARWRGVGSGIKAGSYSISHRLTPEELLVKLVRGDVTQGEVVLVDGLTFRQWRARLDREILESVGCPPPLQGRRGSAETAGPVDGGGAADAPSLQDLDCL
ncbi:MAG: endolytic transglycosylase MltG, partial [Azonexus sp.]